MTSRLQVSRVRPTSLRLASSREWGVGSPRETSRKSSCFVNHVSRSSRADCSAGSHSLSFANTGNALIAATPLVPQRRKKRRVTLLCSVRNLLRSDFKVDNLSNVLGECSYCYSSAVLCVLRASALKRFYVVEPCRMNYSMPGANKLWRNNIIKHREFPKKLIS